MEVEYLNPRPNFVKHPSETDVKDRLTVTAKMALIMPAAEPGREIPIDVLDDQGDVYHFYLVGRTGPHLKPYFKPKDWRSFIRKRGAKVGDPIYFWPELNASKGTAYRIELISVIHNAVFPGPEGLGMPLAKCPEDIVAMKQAFATSGGLAL